MEPVARKPPLPALVQKALDAALDEVREQIFRDPMTSLLNDQAFESLWKQSPPRTAHLLFIEVDEMKSLNNKFGHVDANRFLEALGDVLQAECGKDAVRLQAFHISGDEFLLLARSLSARQVEGLAARLLRQVRERMVTVGGQKAHFTVSIGIARVDGREAVEGSKTTRDQAEDAMMQAKRDGRNCFRWREDVQKAVEYLKHRKECSHCRTRFELEVPKLEYDARSHFFCPCCGQPTSK